MIATSNIGRLKDKILERGMRCENFNFCKTDRGNVEIMGEETGSRCKN